MTGTGRTVFKTHTADVDSHTFQGINGLSLIRVASRYGYNDWGLKRMRRTTQVVPDTSETFQLLRPRSWAVVTKLAI